MKDKLKPCPFCGNEDLEIQVLELKKDLFVDGNWCIVDIRCNNCKTLKSRKVLGISEEDCIKDAIRLWNRRANND